MEDLQDIATLCKEIDYLTKQVDTLRTERDEARREVCEWATCKQLTKERDEARREVCECKVHQQHDPRQYAQDRGWYCYKSDTLSQEVSQEDSTLPTTISSHGIRITEYIPPQMSVREVPPHDAYTTGECTLAQENTDE